MNYNLCDDFIKYKQYLGYKYSTECTVMNQIREFLITNHITYISKDVIECYARLNPNLNPNTIARNMSVFREFCKYLRIQGIDCYQIPNNIYSSQSRQYIPYIFTKEEVINIIKTMKNVTIKDYLRNQTLPLIIRILYQTGMRIGEILNLKIEDYNQEEKYFIIRESKNGEERRIYLSDNLNISILNYHNKFHFKTQNIYFFQLTDGKIDVKTIERSFYQALNICNIGKNSHTAHVHDLRHTFIVRSIEQAYKEGKNMNIFLVYLQTYVGHRTPQSLAYYFRMTKQMIGELNINVETTFGYLIPNLEECNYD